MSRFAWDVALVGPLFLDYGLVGLDARPRSGTEVFAAGAGISPGGIATLAVASARLGLRTTLAAPFGTDAFGDWCWSVLGAQERVDLSGSVRIAGMPTPVTVALAHDDDRSMITYAPGADDAVRALRIEPSARAVMTDLKTLDPGAGEPWWRTAAQAGTRIFADIGWDSTERWRESDLAPLASCHAFTPNEREAMAYTRTDDPVAAARALAERVPLVVVTRGADGVVAVDSAAGEEVAVPALPVHVVDPTGAGDVFTAALVHANLHGLSLLEQVRFATLAASIAVTRRGSALAAPGWEDLRGWWQRAQQSGETPLVDDHAFLDDILPAAPQPEAAPAPDALPSLVSSAQHSIHPLH